MRSGATDGGWDALEQRAMRLETCDELLTATAHAMPSPQGRRKRLRIRKRSKRRKRIRRRKRRRRRRRRKRRKKKEKEKKEGWHGRDNATYSVPTRVCHRRTVPSSDPEAYTCNSAASHRVDK